jgi:hypothetical protein
MNNKKFEESLKTLYQTPIIFMPPLGIFYPHKDIEYKEPSLVVL